MPTSASDKREFDVVVVGAGAAGVWAAKELTEGGATVLLLEAGRSIDTDRDFPPNPRPGGVGDRVKAALRGQWVQARGGNFGPSTGHFYVNDRENPYTVRPGSSFLWLRGRQVGGRLHTWHRAALRMSDFELRGANGQRDPDLRWPISYGDLAPYYDKVERTLGVLGDCDGIANLPDGRYDDPGPLSPANRLLAERVPDRTGLTLIRNRVVRHNPSRIPLPLAIAQETGRLEVRADAIVSHILIDRNSGKAAGVCYIERESKACREAFCRVVVLCASALESVRVLLNSACPQHPVGIGGSSGLLGRYVCDHVMYWMSGETSGDYRDTSGGAESSPGSVARDPYDFGAYCMYLPDFCGRWGDRPVFLGGYGLQCAVKRDTWWALAFGEMLPRYENRVTLDPTKKDAWGIPVAHIDVRHSENENTMVGHMRGSIGQIVEAAGLSIAVGGGRNRPASQRPLMRMLRPLLFEESGAFHPGTAMHETGGARMGRSPETSVLNSYCQCWDVPNVFVTDGACFVSSGYQNHTLTIMALTVRACDYILREYRKQMS